MPCPSGSCVVADDDDATDVGAVDDDAVVVEATEIGVAVMTGSRRSGSLAGMGWADWVVVLRAGAKASASIALRLKGNMPVLQKALRIVSSVNAFSRALE